MEILWIAIILYSAGLALVLHFRPAIMFNQDGTWKEFGYQRSPRHTLLPFWLFVIIWAFLSYSFAAAAMWLFARPTLASSVSSLAAASTAYSSSEETDGEEEEEEDEEAIEAARSEELPMQSVSTLPVKRGPGRPRKTLAEKPQPGYYVREDTGTENGLHRYIYYGPEAPPTGKQDMMQQ